MKLNAKNASILLNIVLFFIILYVFFQIWDIKDGQIKFFRQTQKPAANKLDSTVQKKQLSQEQESEIEIHH